MKRNMNSKIMFHTVARSPGMVRLSWTCNCQGPVMRYKEIIPAQKVPERVDQLLRHILGAIAKEVEGKQGG